jgi:hypothetical protein
MTQDNTVHKCPKHGLFRWKYDERLGVYVTDMVAKKSDTTTQSPCSKTMRKRPDLDKLVDRILGVGPL